MLTESEIEALDDDIPVTSSDGPPVTTAPPGASTEQVEAGMREARLIEEQKRGRKGQYSEEGSLGHDQRRERHGKKAGERSKSGA